MPRKTYKAYLSECYEDCNCAGNMFVASNARPLLEMLAQKLDGESWGNIVINNDAAPALGELANSAEYRCINAQITTAPSMTIAAIENAAAEFNAAVIFKAPNTNPPVIINNSGATLKCVGQDVNEGEFTPVADTVYRLSFVYDGINLNCFIAGVA